MSLTANLSMSLVCSAVAVALYILSALWRHDGASVVQRRVFSLAWSAHALAWAGDLMGWGDSGVPHFGFASALSVTCWLVLAFYALEQRWIPQVSSRWALGGLGAAAVLLAMVFPGKALHVNASGWLPLHWAFGLASYGLFAVAVVHAVMMTRAERQMRMAADVNIGMPLLSLERLTFRFVSAGFVLLSATLIVGWWFGDQLYGTGHGWQWNHKTIFSVLSWLCFAVLLFGRAQLGWRGRTAVRVLYTGTGLLLLAYVGSRFVLEVVLGRSA
jgi:ABC-type uncharacterized transport system permease subunit